jgi:hypothetical protein
VGLNDAGTVAKYDDCDGIREMANRSAFFVPLTTQISYDSGPGTGSTGYCSGSTGGITLSSGNRVTVSVTAHYKPMVNLIPINQRDIISISSRTVLGILQLAAPGGSGGSSGGSSTNTPTATTVFLPTNTPLGTSTFTLTPNPVNTLTPQPSPTITLLPSSTPTFTPTLTPTITLTPTETYTPTATFTPTATSTPVDTCSITAGPINMSATSPFITMTLTNPYVDVTVSSIYLHWNGSTGAPGSKSLMWTATILAGTSWSVNNSSGDYTSVPSTTVTLPGYNVTSTLTIAFNNNYKFPLGTNQNTITVNFSTPGCASITQTK